MSKARSPCAVCSTTIGINGLIRYSLIRCSQLGLCALKEPSGAVLTLTAASSPAPLDRRSGASQHPHHGGARLSQVDVVFEVASQPYPLDERAATLMAENLRVKAAHEPGAEGAAGARPVADAIELRLIEDTDDPITLGGDGAEAVYYALNVPNGGGDQLSALYDAVKRLHDERPRQTG